MAMQWRRVEALHEVEGDRWVDHEAEQAGAHHVPERNRHEEVNGPFVALNPGRQTAVPKVIHGGIPNHRERYHFESSEYGAEGQGDSGRPGEIQVMAGADDAARQEDSC